MIWFEIAFFGFLALLSFVMIVITVISVIPVLLEMIVDAKNAIEKLRGEKNE